MAECSSRSRNRGVNRERIFRHIDEHLDEHVAHIQQWVRQKSVSWDNPRCRDRAELVARPYPADPVAGSSGHPRSLYPGVWASTTTPVRR
jgi:hypothetical protein